MFGEILGKLVDKEKVTFDTIQSALEEVSIELGCSHKELFIMIKPENEKFDPRFYIYKIEGTGPRMVREITLKEILDIEEEEGK